MKFAFFGVPAIGGVYTVYRTLREGLAIHGIDICWVGLGPKATSVMADPDWSQEHAFGIAIAGDTEDEHAQAAALLDAVGGAGFDGVFVNVLAHRVQMNAARYLDPRILRLMIVHNVTPGTYAAARALRDHVHATIGVSARIRDDLVRKLGFAPDRTHAVPNGIDERSLPAGAKDHPAEEGTLRLLTLGRVEDVAKGVFWLPKIMERLGGTGARLTVAGDGPDLAELQRRCAHLAGRVDFLGRVQPDAVPAVLARHDVLLFPSRFEGFGLSLAEAMAAGCVPVASRISGVTDTIVTDGTDGFLFPVGGLQMAAGLIRRLAEDRPMLARMSAAARLTARERFSLGGMAAAYAGIIGSMKVPPPIAAPLPAERWHFPAGLRPGLRTFLPEPVKNALRMLRARVAQ